MGYRDASVRPRWPPTASTGESSNEVSPASPPVISTVCVDVRELLRCSATTSKVTPFDARASVSDQHPDTAVDLPAVPRQPPWQPQVNPQLYQRASTFWSPSYPPLGGFAVNSGPPPLSPTDATVLHSILHEPSKRTTIQSGCARMPGLTRSPLAQEPRARRPTLGSDAAAPPPATPSVWQFSANTPPPPYDDSSARGTLADAEDCLHLSRVDTATPFSMSTEEDTCPPTPLPVIQERFLKGDGLKSTDAATSAGLSPVAQRTIRGILGQLESCSKELKAADDGAVIGNAKSSSFGAVIAPLVPFRQAPIHTSVAGPSAASPALLKDTFAHVAKGSSAAAAVRPTMAQLWKLCPALAASTFGRLDTHRHRPQGTVQVVFAPQRGLTHNRTHGTADRSAVPPLTSSWSPRRTVPPAFRRHLQFAEAAPTTRRPKRK